MMRQSHRKSRYGCQQCKRRKVKCDETKPKCQKCAVSSRDCSYLTSLPAQRHSTQVTDSDPISPVTQFKHSESATPGIDSVSALNDTGVQWANSFSVAERYSLLHLELFDHLRDHLINVTQPLQPDSAPMFEAAYREGLRENYLMDQLLALAAAHKSTTVTGELKHLYHTEATRLQSRALTQLSLDQNAATKQNSFAVFAFSAVLGLHVLFDIFSSGVDLSTTLDQLVHCFNLHQGIRITASEAWEKMQSIVFAGRPDNEFYHKSNDQITTIGTDCDGLLHRLRQSGVDQESFNVYSQTVKTLQYLFDSVRLSPARSASVVQEWPVRISSDYISLLRQRRPEALVVLAYYAVLLHYSRDHWAIGDSGRRLIESISKHLGDYWADWLQWPTQALEGDEAHHRSTSTG